MMASKKPFTLVLSGILALSMLSPAALAAGAGGQKKRAAASEKYRPACGHFAGRPGARRGAGAAGRGTA